MMVPPEIIRKSITIADLEKESGFSRSTILAWINEGLLPVFLPPGKRLGDRRAGRKGIRVWVDDWQRFVIAQTKIAKAKAEKPSLVLPLKPSGLDGKSRL